MAASYPSYWTLIGDGSTFGKSLYRCVCGVTREVFDNNVKYGTSRSCGCQMRQAAKNRTKHGMHSTPEYQAWSAIKQRCNNPKCGAFHLYGGRGIKVSEMWLGKRGFQNFYEDMGPRPSSKHSIERIDNNYHYEPNNCRWATDEEQNRNRRDNNNVTFNGVTLCVAAWAKEVGIPENVLRSRVALGWDFERAITEPVNAKPVLERTRVETVRSRYHKGSYTDGGPALAREFGVSYQTIMRIVERTIAKYNYEESTPT